MSPVPTHILDQFLIQKDFQFFHVLNISRSFLCQRAYCQKFLNDIINSIPQKYYLQTEIILKLKKDYNNIDTNYRVLVESIVRNKKIRLITDISPESIIEVSDATISIPFTSTAVTSYNKNKETIYYDPSGKLTKNNCLEKNPCSK